MLARMRRGYTREAYLDLVQRIRECTPGPTSLPNPSPRRGTHKQDGVETSLRTLPPPPPKIIRTATRPRSRCAGGVGGCVRACVPRLACRGALVRLY
jgi:hypothetical protein